MKNYIFNQAANSIDHKYYCLVGTHDFIDSDGMARIQDAESKSVAAKCIQSKKPKHFNSPHSHYKYYIKATPSGQAYNPIEYHKINDKKSNFIDAVCKKEWFFREVDQFIFNKYLKFLNTQNLSWLKEVERDLK